MLNRQFFNALFPAVLLVLLLMGGESIGRVMPQSPTDDDGSKKIKRQEYSIRRKEYNKKDKDSVSAKKIPRQRVSPQTEGINREDLANTIVGLYQLKTPSTAPISQEKSLRHRVLFKGFVQELIDLDTPLGEEDKVRVAVKIPYSGYLYIVNTEEFGNKEKNPALIFPTKKINNGNNYFKVGKITVLPNEKDNPMYFELSFKAGQTAEVLRFLITERPLADIRIREKEYQLSPTEFDELRGEALSPKLERAAFTPTSFTSSNNYLNDVALATEQLSTVTMLYNPIAKIEFKIRLSVGK
jgi:hypothetical protein